MESELKILLKNGFISRKQLREMLALRTETPEQLRDALLEKQFLDAPDWKEAAKHLEKNGAPAKSSAPDSANPAMLELHETAMRVAATYTTVLVLGESGVGKTRLARLIHERSPRRSGPFVTVSCGSIPETLLESELFGVEKGAYTGAVRTREGRFQVAHGGTIFLDEIGELTPGLQVKLLRVIQERKIEPLGSGKEQEVDIRLIAATNRNLEEDTREGRFREDLFFRLNVVPLTMLPLRERREDIVPLTRYFLSNYRNKDGIDYELDGDILAVLSGYGWPGNIRELENCIERLAVLSRGGQLRADDFPPRVLRETNYKPGMGAATPPTAGQAPRVETTSYTEDDFPTLKDIEARHIELALRTSRGNVYRAANLLQIHRNTLARKLEEMKLNPASFKKNAQRKSG